MSQNIPVEITPLAAKRFKEVLEKEQDPKPLGIRVGVKGGSCAGFSYMIDFQREDAPEEWFVYDQWGVKIYVDQYSGPLLDGTLIDYEEGLMKSGFKFDNPNSESYRTCGCGKSFSP